MIKAIIFDCFGVLIMDKPVSYFQQNSPHNSTYDEFKNKELLDYIKQLKNRYKVAILSNISCIESLYDRFTQEEIENLFDEVVASGEIGFAKPQAQAYEKVADKLGVHLDECIMIDDCEDYCMAAKSVGMKSVLYQSVQQTKRQIDNYLNLFYEV